MCPGMRSQGIEGFYARNIDNQRLADVELAAQGIPAEEFVVQFYDGFPELKARLSTPEEDKGSEIGGRQTVDIVVSFPDGKPAFATQVTTSAKKEVRDKKIKEMFDHPFVRVDEMTTQDVSIPKILVFLEATQIRDFFKDPNMKKHPELPLKVIDDHIRSLTFDLSQTQYPPQRQEVSKLLALFQEERNKYIH